MAGLILFILLSPLFLIISGLLLLQEGWPLFYLSYRLGKDKKKFAMYKFRTLPVNSDKLLTNRLFNYTQCSLPFFTKFLRETRLDELPQFINIITGDMFFIGPRPVRPEIYESMCQGIARYDLRFSIRPGLVGFAQLFTPDSTPKRLRSFIDNKLAIRNKSLIYDFQLLSLTAFAVCKKIVSMEYNFFRTIFYSKMLGRFKEKRFLDRIKHNNALCITFFNNDFTNEIYQVKLTNINELYFCISSEQKLDLTPEEYWFKLKAYRGKRSRTAKVKGVFFQAKEDEELKVFKYVFEYSPLSDFQHYLIDQYFLKKSVYQL